MGVYIKGMEMPKDKAVYIVIDNGEVFVKPRGALHWTHLDEHAIELPPHGRLIDADALMKQVEHDTPLSAVYEKTMRRYLNNAPTVIEAEQSEDQCEYEAAVESAQHCELYEPTYDPDTGAL